MAILRRKKFVDLAKYGFSVEPRYYFYHWSRSPKIFTRESVARKLVQAKKYLPKGYDFKIWDSQRPRYVQIEMAKSFLKRLKFLYPNLNKKEIRKKLIQMAGTTINPARFIKNLSSHRRGGAMDLTIVDKKGQELEMGTSHDDLTKKASWDFYKTKKRLNFSEKKIRKNRRLLFRVLTKAGFEPYKLEWWHWSYKN